MEISWETGIQVIYVYVTFLWLINSVSISWNISQLQIMISQYYFKQEYCQYEDKKYLYNSSQW